MWIGVILLLFGVIGILIGYLVPPRHVLLDAGDPKGNAYVDEKAQEYNTTLDMCKLTGLIFFCIGGVTLAMALLFPSFLTHYCDEESRGEDPAIKVPLQEDADKGPVSPLQMVIPASSKVKSVQPDKKSEQQMLTQTSSPTDQ
ncbi:neurensin-1 [Aplysia californica]|uniref:Neurensin-1 n=1 Tax=Aplysia californica TaxID=6500 RepID=A0ABM0JSI7_APLCA|nr:neurensin-1 [Aplysia californica]